jgi:dynactin complex subunit
MKKSGQSRNNFLKELRIELSPSLSSEEKWAVVIECKTRIEYLEETVKELKQELKNHEKEDVKTQRYISDRRLAIYLAITSILSGFAIMLIELLLPHLM